MTSRSHRCVAVLTVLALLLTVVSAVTAFAAADIEGHWAQDAIEQLVEKGAVSGLPDGTFRPDLTVTRSEFVTMVNKSLGITSVIGSSRFQDVKPGDWFAGQVEAAAAYGYVAGNPDGTFSPYRPITREQAAAMLVRAFGLNKLTTEAEQNAVLSSFVDAGQVSAWAKADVATAVSIGLMSGYTSSTLAPQPVGLTTAGWQRSEGARTTEQREAVLKQLGSHGLITRAEIAAVLVRALAPEPGIAVTVFDEAGTYGPKEGVETISSDVIVKADGVTLQNLIITGNLIIDASVGDGTVVLENVTVKGDAEVKGGGTNGVIFRGCTLHGTVIVEKVDSKIRIVAEGSTSIPKVVLQSGAILISQDDGSFERVELPKDLAKGTEVVLTGNFAKIEIAAQKANVTVGEGSTIDELVLSKNASETQVELDKKASVNTVIANAKVEITGQGSIAKAKINISGVLIEQKPDKVILAEGVRANVAGKDVPESKKSTGGGGPSKPTEILVSAINIATNPSVTASVDNNAKVEVTLTTATSSADIYYTTDGMTPTTSSSKYSVPFIVDTDNTAGETITIKAIGIKAGYKNSAVAEKEIVFKVIEAEFAGGDGSSGNPYQVTTAEHLNNVRNHINDHFIQTEDIDLKSYLSEGGAGYNDGAGWIPIGERF
ncbi:MAG: S-layer homology domain-containing protein, partial [bacterium]